MRPRAASVATQDSRWPGRRSSLRDRFHAARLAPIGPVRLSTRSRHAYRARSPLHVPRIEDRTGDVATDGDASAKGFGFPHPNGDDLDDWPAPLRHDERLMRLRDTINQSETFCLELSSRDGPLGHGHDDMTSGLATSTRDAGPIPLIRWRTMRNPLRPRRGRDRDRVA